MGYKPLQGRTALITGAGKGFGRGIADRFIEYGADVALHYRSSRDGVDELIELAAAKGVRAVAVQADLTDKSAIDAMVAEARAKIGLVDVLVNNAGVMHALPFLEATEQDWADEVAVNVVAPLYTCRAVLPGMIENGYGKIINLSSQLAFRGWETGAVYGGTKGFSVSWTKSMAVEFGPHGIRVNAIAPGGIITDMNRYMSPDEESIKESEATLPLRKMGTPLDIGESAAYLASPQSDFVTGQTLGVNGGRTTH